MSNSGLGQFVDTICAPITPPGVGGVSIVRVSGERAFEVSGESLRGIDLSTLPAATAHRCSFVADGTVLDEVLALVFRTPHSYTTENVVEIHCHGNPVIVDTILGSLVQRGCRLAEPGEFTKRAFLGGRIDLTQAEAVADVIAANSLRASQTAHRHLAGELGERIRLILENLVKIVSLIELELDFVEEGITLLTETAIVQPLQAARVEIQNLRQSYARGRLASQGISVAIIGPPNVGKSSLLNRIAGEQRAIVSEIPGTTRDAISVAIQHHGVRLEFWDTAGLRATEEVIEKAGIAIAIGRAQTSDVVINLIDGSRLSDVEQLQQQDFSSAAPGSIILLVANKSDLHTGPLLVPVQYQNIEIIEISAKTGYGIDPLLDRISEFAIGGNGTEEQVLLTNRRHFESLSAAEESIASALTNISSKSGEFLSVDVRNAIDQLGEIVGAVTSKEILDSIFANFCIGK